MKKNVFLVIVVTLMVLFNSIFCYANQVDYSYEPGWYKLENIGWVYLKDNHEFAKNEWLWINKSSADNLYRHYFFNEFGFLEYSTLTPDGKWVNQHGEEEVNGTVLIAHDSMGNVYTMDELLLYPDLYNNPEFKASAPDVGITNNGSNNVIYRNDMNNNDIDMSMFNQTTEENSLVNKSYTSVYLDYRQRMLNRAIAYARMIENELTSFDIFNGRADVVMKEYKDNLTALFDESIEQIASLNQYKEYDATSIQESNNAILFLQTTYNQCLTKLNDALIVVKSRP